MVQTRLKQVGAEAAFGRACVKHTESTSTQVPGSGCVRMPLRVRRLLQSNKQVSAESTSRRNKVRDTSQASADDLQPVFDTSGLSGLFRLGTEEESGEVVVQGLCVELGDRRP